MFPSIPYPPWRETCRALHLYSQVVGKYRLARTPWLNHSWHATLYVTADGLTTGLVPEGGHSGDAAFGADTSAASPDAIAIEIVLDLARHQVRGMAGDGRSASFPLGAMSVARFHSRFRDLIGALGGTPVFDGAPNELPDAVPFAADTAPRPYDAEAVTRFHGALVAASLVLAKFRTGFLGKASPVHLFWGSFDLAVTRFSGRRAPLHPGGIPHLPDAVTREAYSHEVSSAGFWPGGGGIEEAAFYSYAYPAPEGFAQARVEPKGAFFHAGLGEFLLPYEVVRSSRDPEATLLRFLDTTYEAAATLGHWDRGALECAPGVPRRPRPL